MATFNNANAVTATSTSNTQIVAANLLSSSALTAAAVAEHFDRFILPTSSTAALNLDTFVSAGPHFVNSTTSHHLHQQQSQQQQQQSTSSSYTFLQIKREPCQVSEVTTSNNYHHPPVNSSPSIHNNNNNQHHQQFSS